jgi:hypothetical protein
MKQSEMIALGLAAVAVYLITSTNKKSTLWDEKTGNPLGNAAKAVTEIFNLGGGAFDNGWRYFSDGTAIDPQGNYYHQGQLIWNNTGARWSV